MPHALTRAGLTILCPLTTRVVRLQAAFGLALPDVWASLQQTLEAEGGGGGGGGGGEGGGGAGGAGGEGGARQLCLVAAARLLSSASLGGRAPPSGQPAALLCTVGSLLRPRAPTAAECAVACAALDCISELAERQACRLHMEHSHTRVHVHVHTPA